MYTAAVITISDKGFRGEREDKGGALVCRLLQDAGYQVVYTALVPDEVADIQKELIHCADNLDIALVITTGGTGFSPRDVTPEATQAICQRPVPGIPEAMRGEGLAITNRAMLSRAYAGLRHYTLIVNLPGSPKAIGENLQAILPALDHGLTMLRGQPTDCAAPEAPETLGAVKVLEALSTPASVPPNSAALSHIDQQGQAVMVDVSAKATTCRTAEARGRIKMNRETLGLMARGLMKKGDVFAAARLAGIMAAKRTWELIPLCHPLLLEHCDIALRIDEDLCEIEVSCTVQVTGKTGAEMEALTGAATALLTIYDMGKAADRAMVIHSLCLWEKTGGKSGPYRREGDGDE